MNPQQLMMPEGTPTVAFACGDCGRIFANVSAFDDPESGLDQCGRNRVAADRCGRCDDCATPLGECSFGVCDRCGEVRWTAYQAEKAAEVAGIEFLDDWDGPINSELGGVFDSISEYLTCIDNEGVPLGDRPLFVHICHRVSAAEIADDMIARILRDRGLSEDPAELCGIDDFRAAAIRLIEANERLWKTCTDWRKAVYVAPGR